jgi:predicted Zn-ribbon and HTH transcriptional regulator
VGFADEMRLGLHGQARRVLAARGIKVVQPRQLEYVWAYLLLAVDPRRGVLRWEWIARLRQDDLRPVLERWRLAGLVWDGAGAHRGKRLADLETKRVRLPPYSPELNPAERVFEEVRRHAEGRVYDDLAAKQEAAERYLRALAVDPDRVRRLCGCEWIQEALNQLPPPVAA